VHSIKGAAKLKVLQYFHYSEDNKHHQGANEENSVHFTLAISFSIANISSDVNLTAFTFGFSLVCWNGDENTNVLLPSADA
jgi:hypothetical protein